MDELFLVHEAATASVTVTNTGSTDLVVFTFFGPDINDAPMLPLWGAPPEADDRVR
jgi:hypothetical protein